MTRKFKRYQDYCDRIFKQCKTKNELEIARKKLLDKYPDGSYGFTNKTIDRVFPPLNKRIVHLFNNIYLWIKGTKRA
jgi:hypothetical protein